MYAAPVSPASLGPRELEALALFDSVKDYAIFLVDPEGKVVTWNAGARAIEQYEAAEIIGQNISRFYTPEDLAEDRPRKLLAIAAREGRVEDEGWRVRKDGTRFWADVVLSALSNDQGELIGYAKVTRDLTARRLGEESLRRSEADLAATLHSIGDAVIATDAAARVTRLNPVAEQLTGWSRAEALGRPIAEVFRIVNEHTRAPADNPVTRVLAEGVVVGLANHTAIIARDGREFPIADSGAPIRDDQGAVRGVVLVFRDVSAERRAEEALRQSEERLRLMIASVRDYAIIMLDASGHIATWNTGAEHIKGYRAEEIIGSHFSCFYSQEAIDAGKPAHELEVAAAEGRFEEEGWRLRKDGSRFWANVVLSAMRDADGELVGFTKVTRDLTERRRADRELARRAVQSAEERARTTKAEEAVRARDVFLSVAAHELRTPLTALQLKLQGLHALFQLEPPDPSLAAKASTRFDDALRQTARLAELVERLLDVSRIATGRFEMQPEPIELSRLVQDAVKDVCERAVELRVDIRVSVSGDTHGQWDRGRIEQALLNLLSNAVKYGQRKPVDVGVEGRDGEVIVVVADRGIGIAEGDLDRIFEPFERAAPVQHFAGLGLGLHITRRIIEAHGGSVTVASAVGEGSTFTVRLPKITPAKSPPPGEKDR